VRRGEEIPPDSDDAGLRAAADRVGELRPEDRGLRRVRGRLLAALRDARGLAGARGARRMLAESEAVNSGLDRYAHREPLIAVFLPD
jgi:hypothetical protein